MPETKGCRSRRKYDCPVSILPKWGSVLLVLCLARSAQFASGTRQPFKLAQSPDCGIINTRLNDTRATLPWTAAIYLRSPTSKSGYQFYVTGTVISESTVITVAGGVFGAFPRGAKRKYFISPSNSYRVGVGLTSTNMDEADQYTQFSEVSYILPYTEHVKSNKHYHYLLFHLKKPLNFSTPYVKPVCLPLLLRETNFAPFKWHYFQGGFARPARSDGSLPLTRYEINGGSEKECNSVFRYYYKGSGSGEAYHTFCGRRSTRDPNEEDSCQLHGSVCMFSVLDRWYLTGITALIPARKRGMCSRATTYIYSEELLYAKGRLTMEWIIRSLKCSPNHFACKNSTCIPLSSVCNLTPDCDQAEDEDPTYCEAVNHCISPESSHQCGLGGKCILKQQICDEVPDCPDKSDEGTAACAKVAGGDISVLQRSLRSCPPLNVTSGVVATCRSQLTREVQPCDAELEPGSVAILSCDKYTTPLFSIDSIELECDERSRWKPTLPFSCETECGEVKSTGTGPSNRLPWTAALYQMGPDGAYRLFCSGTLLEPSFLITSANCLFEASKLDSAKLQERYKIVVSPISNDFIANSKDSVTQILNAKEIWIPSSYSSRTQSSELALLKFVKPVKLGGYVRPACYTFPSTTVMPEAGKSGKVSRFSSNNKPEPVAHYDFPVHLQETCSKAIGSGFSTIFTFCAGFKNDSGLCGTNNGGGIFIPNISGKSTRFILEGVVTQKDDCSPDTYAVFTSLQAFEDWLFGILEVNS